MLLAEFGIVEDVKDGYRWYIKGMHMIEDLKIHVSSEETQTKIELSGELDDFSAPGFMVFDAYQFFGRDTYPLC